VSAALVPALQQVRPCLPRQGLQPRRGESGRHRQHNRDVLQPHNRGLPAPNDVAVGDRDGGVARQRALPVARDAELAQAGDLQRGEPRRLGQLLRAQRPHRHRRVLARHAAVFCQDVRLFAAQDIRSAAQEVRARRPAALHLQRPHHIGALRCRQTGQQARRPITRAPTHALPPYSACGCAAGFRPPALLSSLNLGGAQRCVTG